MNRRLELMKWKLKSRTWKTLLLVSAMLLVGGVASAQAPTSGVLIKGNVFGGGRLGKVKNTTAQQGEQTVTVIDSTAVLIYEGVVKGSVYGGGMGDTTNYESVSAGLVEGNTHIEMIGGTVERSIYGGGQLGSVGTFTDSIRVVYTKGNDDPDDNDTVYVPKNRSAEGTGLARVLIKGGQVGKTEKALMPNTFLPEDDDYGYVFCGGRGEADSISYHQAIAMGVVDSTYLEISGTPIITASVYGGSENGLVLGNTHVKVLSGQIGLGYNRNATGDDRWCIYTDAQWAAAINAVKSTAGGDEQTAQINAIAGQFYMCDAWPYGDNNGHYNVYDIFYGQPIDPDDPDSPLYQNSMAAVAVSILSGLEFGVAQQDR